MKRIGCYVTATLVVLTWSAAAFASPCDTTNGAWLVCEDFEGADAGWGSWFEQSAFTECNGCPDGQPDPGRIQLTDAESHTGSWSLHMPAAESADFRGASLTYRSCADEKRPGCPSRLRERWGM